MEAADVTSAISLLNKSVEILLNLNDTIITGTIYTLDPVSQNVILLKKESDNQTTLLIIMKHSIKDIKILEDQEQIDIEAFIPSQTKANSQEATIEEISSWLKLNRLEFQVKDGGIEVEGINISPPFRSEDCRGTNWLVLSRVQKILAQRADQCA